MSRKPNPYGELLSQHTDSFIEIRDKFNVGSELGLASFFQRHTYSKELIVVPFTNTSGGMFVWPGYNGESQEPGFFKPTETQPLIISPNGIEGKLYVASMYYKNPSLGSTDDPLLDRLNGESVRGAFVEIIGQYNEIISTGTIDFEQDAVYRRDDLAKQLGFADDLVAYLTVRVEYLSQDNGRPHFKGFGRADESIDNNNLIQQIEERIRRLREE